MTEWPLLERLILPNFRCRMRNLSVSQLPWAHFIVSIENKVMQLTYLKCPAEHGMNRLQLVPISL